MLTVTYRKKAMYIVHRTPDMVASLAGHDGSLKDAASRDSEQPEYATNANRAPCARISSWSRAPAPTWAACPRPASSQGCMPELGADWPGGFFCPCHGSRFDLAGRVFEGSPASQEPAHPGRIRSR